MLVQMSEHGSGSTAEYFRLGGMRLYQPDDVLATRLPNGVGELAAYCKTLAWVGTEYFGRLGRDFGSLGVLIVVGIKPHRRTRIWCESVEGVVPSDAWDVFVDLLDGAGENVWPTVTKPVAFALECVLGAGPSNGFPMVPKAWQEAIADRGGRVTVPDELFGLVSQTDRRQPADRWRPSNARTLASVVESTTATDSGVSRTLKEETCRNFL
jgi:hypothetical protein